MVFGALCAEKCTFCLVSLQSICDVVLSLFSDHHSVRMGLLDVTVLHAVPRFLEIVSSICVQRRWLYLIDCRLGNGCCHNDHYDSYLL